MLTIVGNRGNGENEPIMKELATTMGKRGVVIRGVTTGGDPRVMGIGNGNSRGGLP